MPVDRDGNRLKKNDLVNVFDDDYNYLGHGVILRFMNSDARLQINFEPFGTYDYDLNHLRKESSLPASPEEESAMETQADEWAIPTALPLAPAPALFPTGSTSHPKLIFYCHGKITGLVKKLIYFPYNRLIYYVNKGKLLMNTNIYGNFSQICNGKATTIKHKIPINNKLETYPQTLSVGNSLKEQQMWGDTMGVYICNTGMKPEKIYSWLDLNKLIYKSNPPKAVQGYDGLNYHGILLEDLLQFVTGSGLQFRGVNLSDIDINVYSCRPLCTLEEKDKSPFEQYEQVSYPGIPIYGGNGEEKEGEEKKGEEKTFENVNEDDYFQYLNTCEMPIKKIKGGRRHRKTRKTRKHRGHYKTRK